MGEVKRIRKNGRAHFAAMSDKAKTDLMQKGFSWVRKKAEKLRQSGCAPHAATGFLQDQAFQQELVEESKTPREVVAMRAKTSWRELFTSVGGWSK